MFFFFFFKQKTAYEIYQCDWSSDVCSSDLRGIAIGSIFPPDENGHVEPVRYGEGSGFWKIFGAPMIFGNTFGNRAGQLLKYLFTHPVRWFRVYFTKDFSKRSVILLFMQHLDSTIKFKRGLFSLKSTMSTGPKPTPFMPMAKRLAGEMEKVIDGNSFMISTDILTGAPSTAHILGGAVIGENPEKGVIDVDQKVFGYQNMYVCDGSAVSANPGVNPSLSITAMTERAMSKIPEKKDIKGLF